MWSLRRLTGSKREFYNSPTCDLEQTKINFQLLPYQQKFSIVVHVHTGIPGGRAIGGSKKERINPIPTYIFTFSILFKEKRLINNSVLPIFRSLTNKKINHVTIGNDDIVSLIRKINPNKATGSDGISGQMLLLCDESVILPLQIIFTNILSTCLYPDM